MSALQLIQQLLGSNTSSTLIVSRVALQAIASQMVKEGYTTDDSTSNSSD